MKPLDVDDELESRIAQGDVPGVRAHLTASYGLADGGRPIRPWSLGWWIGHLCVRRGRLRRTCLASFKHAVKYHDPALLDAILPHLNTNAHPGNVVGALTPLGRAAQEGFLDGVERLLPRTNLRRRFNKLRAMGLSQAAEKGHRAVVQRLIRPDVLARLPETSRNEDLLAATTAAARTGHLDVMEDLLAVLPPAVTRAHVHDLMSATLRGEHLACLERLMTLANPNLPIPYHRGRNLLMTAAFHGHPAIVQRLLAVPGANPRQLDEEGNSLLMLAAQSGSVPTLRAVLALGDPQVEARRTNRKGETALILAAAAHHPPSCQLIPVLMPFSDPSHQDLAGRTAFATAVYWLDFPDPGGIPDPPDDIWKRLDLLAFHEPDRTAVDRLFERPMAQARMPQWAVHLERLALRATLDELVQVEAPSPDSDGSSSDPTAEPQAPVAPTRRRL